jgi:hypothetical protein
VLGNGLVLTGIVAQEVFEVFADTLDVPAEVA